MSQKSRKETLADQIADILSAAPASQDPEDDTAEETRAQVTEALDEDDGNDDELSLSQFRRQNVDLLEDVDLKYAGRKRSRKDLIDSEDELSDFDASIEEAAESSEQEESFIDASEDDLESNASTDNESDFKHVDMEVISKEMQKGLCVRNQLSIWESLLEMRIQLQKCLATSNRLPHSDVFKQMQTQGSPEFAAKVAETTTTLHNTLEKFQELQTACVQKFPETKLLLDENAEEVTSETQLASFHSSYLGFRDATINKWYEKVRVAVKTGGGAHSVSNQIQHVLADKTRLVKRTQLKRTEYDVVGAKKREKTDQDARMTEEYDAEIFDDNDFYHQLLRELIERKTADATDTAQLGRQWVQLQTLRSKMKRKVDTRATKGRKVRYAVHSKLVNFMAPIDAHVYTDDAKTELFGSLFGKGQLVTM